MSDLFCELFEDEEEETVTLTEEEQQKADLKREKQDKLLMYGTVAFSIVLSVAILSCFLILLRDF